jgi:aspartyl protease family protein
MRTIFYLLFPLMTLGLLWFGADAFFHNQAYLKKLAASAFGTAFSRDTVTPELPLSKTKALVIKADTQGHFRGTVFINNIKMPYLIDTGATKTSIPAKLAVSAGLAFGSPLRSHTAGGTVIDHETHINSLKLGNAEIRNLDANINEYLDEVLIGMNTLKYFQLTQSGGTMTLAALKQSGQNAASVQVLDKPDKKPFTVKKTVTCDQRQVCITAYSDH